MVVLRSYKQHMQCTPICPHGSRGLTDKCDELKQEFVAIRLRRDAQTEIENTHEAAIFDEADREFTPTVNSYIKIMEQVPQRYRHSFKVVGKLTEDSIERLLQTEADLT